MECWPMERSPSNSYHHYHHNESSLVTLASRMASPSRNRLAPLSSDIQHHQSSDGTIASAVKMKTRRVVANIDEGTDDLDPHLEEHLSPRHQTRLYSMYSEGPFQQHEDKEERLQKQKQLSEKEATEGGGVENLKPGNHDLKTRRSHDTESTQQSDKSSSQGNQSQQHPPTPKSVVVDAGDQSATGSGYQSPAERSRVVYQMGYVDGESEGRDVAGGGNVRIREGSSSVASSAKSRASSTRASRKSRSSSKNKSGPLVLEPISRRQRRMLNQRVQHKTSHNDNSILQTSNCSTHSDNITNTSSMKKTKEIHESQNGEQGEEGDAKQNDCAISRADMIISVVATRDEEDRQTEKINGDENSDDLQSPRQDQHSTISSLQNGSYENSNTGSSNMHARTRRRRQKSTTLRCQSPMSDHGSKRSNKSNRSSRNTGLDFWKCGTTSEHEDKDDDICDESIKSIEFVKKSESKDGMKFLQMSMACTSDEGIPKSVDNHVDPHGFVQACGPVGSLRRGKLPSTVEDGFEDPAIAAASRKDSGSTGNNYNSKRGNLIYPNHQNKYSFGAVQSDPALPPVSISTEPIRMVPSVSLLSDDEGTDTDNDEEEDEMEIRETNDRAAAILSSSANDQQFRSFKSRNQVHLQNAQTAKHYNQDGHESMKEIGEETSVKNGLFGVSKSFVTPPRKLKMMDDPNDDSSLKNNESNKSDNKAATIEAVELSIENSIETRCRHDEAPTTSKGGKSKKGGLSGFFRRGAGKNKKGCGENVQIQVASNCKDTYGDETNSSNQNQIDTMAIKNENNAKESTYFFTPTETDSSNLSKNSNNRNKKTQKQKRRKTPQRSRWFSKINPSSNSLVNGYNTKTNNRKDGVRSRRKSDHARIPLLPVPEIHQHIPSTPETYETTETDMTGDQYEGNIISISLATKADEKNFRESNTECTKEKLVYRSRNNEELSPSRQKEQNESTGSLTPSAKVISVVTLPTPPKNRHVTIVNDEMKSLTPPKRPKQGLRVFGRRNDSNCETPSGSPAPAEMNPCNSARTAPQIPVPPCTPPRTTAETGNSYTKLSPQLSGKNKTPVFVGRDAVELLYAKNNLAPGYEGPTAEKDHSFGLGGPLNRHTKMSPAQEELNSSPSIREGKMGHGNNRFPRMPTPAHKNLMQNKSNNKSLLRLGLGGGRRAERAMRSRDDNCHPSNTYSNESDYNGMSDSGGGDFGDLGAEVCSLVDDATEVTDYTEENTEVILTIKGENERKSNRKRTGKDSANMTAALTAKRTAEIENAALQWASDEDAMSGSSCASSSFDDDEDEDDASNVSFDNEGSSSEEETSAASGSSSFHSGSRGKRPALTKLQKRLQKTFESLDEETKQDQKWQSKRKQEESTVDAVSAAARAFWLSVTGAADDSNDGHLAQEAYQEPLLSSCESSSIGDNDDDDTDDDISEVPDPTYVFQMFACEDSSDGGDRN